MIFSIIFLLFISVAAQDAGNKLLYANFEKLDKEKHLISARDGKVMFESNSQVASNKPRITPRLLGAEGTLSQRIGFEFEITKPNDWANVLMKVVGLKDKGRLTDEARTLLVKADDLTAYHFLTLEIGAAGVNQVRIELQSEGNGIDVAWYHPTKYLDITNQMKPYKIPLTDFKQNDGAPKKIKIEDFLKKVTAITIGVMQTPSKGFVVVDNIAFEK